MRPSIILVLVFALAACGAPPAWEPRNDAGLDAVTADTLTSDAIDSAMAEPCGVVPCSPIQVCVRGCTCDRFTDPTCGHCVDVPIACGSSLDCACLEPLCEAQMCGRVEGRQLQCACPPSPDVHDFDATESAPADASDGGRASECEALPQSECRVRPECNVQCRLMPRCSCACPGNACGCSTCVGSCFYYLGCTARR